MTVKAAARKSWLTNSNRVRLVLEPFSRCQLKCVTCPVTVHPAAEPPLGVLSTETARKTIGYFAERLGVFRFAFGNWSEPFLNKNLLDLVSIAKSSSANAHTYISSNLSLPIDEDAIVKGGSLDFLDVSLSGFTGKTYEIYHKGGDLDLVLSNLEKLSQLKRNSGKGPELRVRWHRYMYNEKELLDARLWCEARGIQFYPYYAHFSCIENLGNYQRGTGDGKVNDFFERNLFSEVTGSWIEGSRGAPCTQSGQYIVNWDGRLLRCCASYQAHLYSSPEPAYLLAEPEVEKFLETPMPHCGECTEMGWAGFFNGQKT